MLNNINDTLQAMAEDDMAKKEFSPIPALRLEKNLDEEEETESQVSTETSTWDDSSVGSDSHATTYSRAKARAKVLRKRVTASFRSFFRPITAKSPRFLD